MLDRLLDLPDNDLWDLISGRAEPGDPSLCPLLTRNSAPHESSQRTSAVFRADLRCLTNLLVSLHQATYFYGLAGSSPK